MKALKILTFKFLYRTTLVLYVLLLTIVVSVLHVFQYYLTWLISGWIPSVKFILSYGIFMIALMLFIFGKTTVNGARRYFLKKIAALKQRIK